MKELSKIQTVRLGFYLLLLFTFISTNAFAQFGKKWSTWETIHQDRGITVELSIYTPSPNSCVDKNSNFKFKYRVTGKYKNRETYLNWTLSYYECNSLRYYQHNSLDLWQESFQDISGGITIVAAEEQFTADYIDKSFYDIQISNSKRQGSGLLPLPLSESPNSIEGINEIFRGKTSELEVTGGSLGEGAKWIWYTGECGEIKIGEGKRIEIELFQTITLFVRAEGENNTTACVEKTIYVDQRSSDPVSITGNADICDGDNIRLKVNGGSLGLNAQWVWYEQACGNNKIGAGEFINVQPRKSTQYFVRAEGELNTTSCVSMYVKVNSPVNPPSSIQVSGSTSICRGESVKLTANISADGLALKWYSGSCGGRYVGSGESISIKPSATTTYFVRAEGVCNKTLCLSKTINVSESSSLPSSIRIVEKGKEKTLEIRGGRLAAGAKWKWYKDSCGEGLAIGNGSSISIRESRQQRTYYVRAEGDCSGSSCTSIVVEPIQNDSRKLQSFNLLHYGLNIGIERNSIEDINIYSSFNINELDGTGIRGEIQFHPIIKDFFSLGLLGAMSVGSSAYVFQGGKIPRSSPVQTDRYFYTHSSLGLDIALGINTVKILARINKEFQHNDLTRTTDNITLSIEDKLNREYVGIGLRVGSYKSKSRADILYFLYRNNNNDFLQFEGAFSGLANRSTGLQFSWCTNNMFTIKSSMYFPVTHQQLLASGLENDNISVYTTILIGLNRFY